VSNYPINGSFQYTHLIAQQIPKRRSRLYFSAGVRSSAATVLTLERAARIVPGEDLVSRHWRGRFNLGADVYQVILM
jgi:hypothetical protein